MPQTKEHFGTVRYMGVERGIIVLTKCDLVDEEWLMLVEEEVQSLVEGSFLAEAPVRHVSSISGEGVDELKKTIEDTLNDIPVKSDHGLFRMPIDRVFSMKGFGTIMAGDPDSHTSPGHADPQSGCGMCGDGAASVLKCSQRQNIGT